MTAIAGHTIYSRSGKLEMGMPVAIVSVAVLPYASFFRINRTTLADIYNAIYPL
jgi:hypothetical protein